MNRLLRLDVVVLCLATLACTALVWSDLERVADRPAPAPHFAGRVEHLASGHAAHFCSPEELLGFLDHILGRMLTPPG